MASATSNPACHHPFQLLPDGQALTYFHTCILDLKAFTVRVIQPQHVQPEILRVVIYFSWWL